MAAQQIVGKIAHAFVHAQLVQRLDALDHLLDLARGVLGGRRPQPGLQTRARAMRRGERRAPPHHQTWLDGLVDLLRKLRLMLAPGGRNHRAQQPLVDDKKPVLIKPAARKSKQPLAVVRAGEFLAQHSHEGTAVMAGEPLKSKRITGKLLVFDQRLGASVHRAQRGQVRSGDAELFAQVPPQ